MKIENTLQIFSCISFLFKLPWENIRMNNSDKIFIARLNISSIRNKFNRLADIMKDNVCILII